jgi:hypothetical protein
MTILERFSAVKNKTLREKLLHNYDAKYVKEYWRSGTVNSDREALKYGFLWSKSPEGDGYWRTLADAMAKNETTFDATFEEVYPEEAIIDLKKEVIARAKKEVIARAGFKWPVVSARKNDPRGAEYGYFAVRMDGNKYVVTKCDADSNREWSATFTEDNFLAWARDNT